MHPLVIHPLVIQAILAVQAKPGNPGTGGCSDSGAKVKQQALAVVGLVCVVLVAGFFWWPPWAASNRGSELLAALMSGLVVALAVVYVERLFTRDAEKRALLIQLKDADLRGTDLSRRDLSGWYAPAKDLTGANLMRANLRKANLSGAILKHADLRKADLRGAKLDKTELYPSETLFPSEDLFPGPIYPDASLSGVKLSGAKFDKHTAWPEGFDAVRAGARRVLSF
jgi:hypothetical protein